MTEERFSSHKFASHIWYRPSAVDRKTNSWPLSSSLAKTSGVASAVSSAASLEGKTHIWCLFEISYLEKQLYSHHPIPGFVHLPSNPFVFFAEQFVHECFESLFRHQCQFQFYVFVTPSVVEGQLIHFLPKKLNYSSKTTNRFAKVKSISWLTKVSCSTNDWISHGSK